MYPGGKVGCLEGMMGGMAIWNKPVSSLYQMAAGRLALELSENLSWRQAWYTSL
jgi:hypothetical protein